jgi:hypothetical protein
MNALIDRGSGVPAEVFEPYFSSKETGKGNGLGLSISFGSLSPTSVFGQRCRRPKECHAHVAAVSPTQLGKPLNQLSLAWVMLLGIDPPLDETALTVCNSKQDGDFGPAPRLPA